MTSIWSPSFVFQKGELSRLFEDTDPFHGKERIENLSPKFRAFVDEKYTYHYSPEEILGYIYAVLHSPTYRQRPDAFA